MSEAPLATSLSQDPDATPIEQPVGVTVVMTVHNGMPYLPDSVQSILDQTWTDFEFLIVNDGSTDKTPDFLATITDPRVRVIHQKRTGQQRAAHRAITEAQGALIARMDSDDISAPTRLEKQVAFLKAHPEVGLVGSQITRRGDKTSGLPSKLPTQHKGIVDDLLKNRHSMCNPATMFRKELYERAGGYWEHNIAEDWDMFLKIADFAQLANIDETLLSYRFHRGSINGRRIVEAQLFNEYAAEAAKRRRDGRPPISYQEFHQAHRSQRFPQSWLFFLDCYSISQYRIGVAYFHSGMPIRGFLHTTFGMACAPGRVIRRVKSKLFGAD